MENILQLVERQRERKANRSVAVSHNSSGSDVHSSATFTVGSLNATHDVDVNHRLLSTDQQQLKHGAIYDGSISRRQLGASATDESVMQNHIRHSVDEPVLLRSENDSLWKKDEPPKVIPRKVASMPLSSRQGRYSSIYVKCRLLCITLCLALW